MHEKNFFFTFTFANETSLNVTYDNANDYGVVFVESSRIGMLSIKLWKICIIEGSPYKSTIRSL